jgi:hypothetical protein
VVVVTNGQCGGIAKDCERQNKTGYIVREREMYIYYMKEENEGRGRKEGNAPGVVLLGAPVCRLGGPIRWEGWEEGRGRRTWWW